MKCPNCGGETGSGNFCEYCGSQLPVSMQKEQEQMRKPGCPRCGSTNTSFNRENQGAVYGKGSNRIIHRTVGICSDCGFTWYPNAETESQSGNYLALWILGWIFFFPAPVMVLIWRKKNTWDVKIKIAVTVAFWLLFYFLGNTGIH